MPGVRVAAACRRHDISTSMVFRWRIPFGFAAEQPARLLSVAVAGTEEASSAGVNGGALAAGSSPSSRRHDCGRPTRRAPCVRPGGRRSRGGPGARRRAGDQAMMIVPRRRKSAPGACLHRHEEGHPRACRVGRGAAETRPLLGPSVRLPRQTGVYPEGVVLGWEQTVPFHHAHRSGRLRVAAAQRDGDRAGSERPMTEQGKIDQRPDGRSFAAYEQRKKGRGEDADDHCRRSNQRP